MHSLAVLSMKNRALIALITVVVAVFGGLALTSLKQELFPSIDFPQLAIVTTYSGASPAVVANDVSTPVEAAIQGVPDLQSTSAVSSTNQSIITAKFVYGTDLATAEQKIDQAINRIKSTLPSTVDPQVLSGSIDDFPVIQLAVTSKTDTKDLAADLTRLALPQLKQVDGVNGAQLIGAVGQRVTITPDPAELAAAGLTTQSITSALTDNGVLVPAGSLTENGKTLSVQSGQQLTTVAEISALPLTPAVSSAGAATAPTGPAQPGLAAGAPTAEIRTIGDVATVEETDDPVTTLSRVNGEPALTIAITKLPSANTVAVSKGVRAQISDIETKLGNGDKVTVVFDQAPFIQQSISSLAEEGLLGLGFAVIVILLFLLSWRATLVTAISIPTSVLITFIGMQAAGYTLNIITLGALTIAIGRVVDDSIVVIENIKRQMVPGADRAATVIRAVREVAGAITASTITTVAVFLPIGFVGDVTGELFRPFALTVTIALLSSLLVALTIVPVLAYWLMRPGKLRKHEAGVEAAPLAPEVGTGVEPRAGSGVEPRSQPGLEPALVGAAADSPPAGAHRAFVPVSEAETQAALAARASHPAAVGSSHAATVQETSAVVAAASVPGREPAPGSEAALASDPPLASEPAPVARTAGPMTVAQADELEHPSRLQKGYLPIIHWTIRHSVVTILAAVLVLVISGVGAMFLKTNFLGSTGQNTISVTQTLEPGASLDAQDDAAKVVEKKLLATKGVQIVQLSIGTSGSALRDAFTGGGGGINFSVTTDPSADQDALLTTVQNEMKGIKGEGTITVSASSGFGVSTDVEIDVTASTGAELQTATDSLVKSLDKLDSLKQVSSNLSASLPYVAVTVDRQKAAAHGLDEVEVGSIVSQANEPTQIGTVAISDNTLDIYLQTKNPPTTIAELSALQIPTATGPVALDTIATVAQTNGPATITTQKGLRSSAITATPATDNLQTSNADISRVLADTTLPAGATAVIGGVTSSQGDAFSQLGTALLAAILIVYIVMVATFRSLLQPIVLLVSIPFAATGAIILQLLSGIPLGVASLIGLLMLIGIVVTNAIVLVDLVNQYRRRGYSVAESVLHGASRRLRPILMTALATIFALMPMAIGLTGGGGFISQPLALVVIGGLLSSTVLTLVVLPTLYNLIFGRRERKVERIEGRTAHGEG